jgi:hypothetical protein
MKGKKVTKNGNISRRSVVGAVWATPVILAAVAAPAAAASQAPPAPVCLDPEGLSIRPVEGQPWKENSGQGFTLVKGDSLYVANDGPFDRIQVPVTVWTANSQEGLRLVTDGGDLVVEAPKDGNRATVTISVRSEELVLLKVVSTSKDAEAHVIIGCDKGFILKSSR